VETVVLEMGLAASVALAAEQSIEGGWISLGITCGIVGGRAGTCASKGFKTTLLSSINMPKAAIFLRNLVVIN
jgi:hypothetical protein